MNISVQQLLRKIENEAREAKNASNENRMRERVHAIKALCELVLDDSNTDQSLTTPSNRYNSQPTQQIQTTTIQQPKRLDLEDDANGDSLFDF